MKTKIEKIEVRERVYRVWDKFRNMMTGIDYDGDNIGLLPSCDNIGTSSYYSNEEVKLVNVSNNGYGIMDFIGAFDKNNKRIYEFDIVKWKEQYGNGSNYSDYIKRNDEIFGLVVWDKEMCGFSVEQLTKGKHSTNIGDSIFEHDTVFYSCEGRTFIWKDLEVVGNKYQNPELLVNTEL